MQNNQTIISELERKFFKELSEARKNTESLDDIAAVPLLAAWHSCLDWASKARLGEATLAPLTVVATSVFNAYETYRQTEGISKRKALRDISGPLYQFENLFSEVDDGTGSADRDISILRRTIDRATDASDMAWGVMSYVGARFEKLDSAVAVAEAAAETAERAVEKAEAAVELAKKAATEASTTKLEASFAKTSKENNTTAWRFRWATMGVLIVTIILGAVFALTHASTEGGQVDWYGIVYRIAILSGLGALAAYLGRQAGNYTRLATWAHGIEIQLKAFLGFVNEIEDGEARQTMFTLFGKRVLESPPDGKSSADDAPTNVIQPIFEHAGKLRPTQ